MQISDYQPGDELEVCAWLGGRTIAEASAVERMTPDIWRWCYTKNPLGAEPLAMIARAEGQLAGYAAAVPSSLIIGGSRRRSAQVFFGVGSPRAFEPLRRALFERIQKHGIELAYGLVGSGYHPLYEALEFVPLFEV